MVKSGAELHILQEIAFYTVTCVMLIEIIFIYVFQPF